MNRLHPLAIAVTLVTALGCAKEPARGPGAGSEKAQGVPAAADSDGHAHGEAPHRGTIIDWGGGVYHVEFTVDHNAKSTAVYILGDDAQTPAPVQAEKLLLTINEPFFQLDLGADAQPGDADGASSRFVGEHEFLGIVREFAGTVSGVVGGTPYAGDFAEGAGDHGHEHH
jgi:hypothetical protein